MENERVRYGLTRTPISGLVGGFDGGSGRRRGGRDGGFWVVQSFDTNRSLALGRNKEKENTYPSKSPSFNLKNVIPVICFSLTNAMISRVTWSGTSPDPGPRSVEERYADRCVGDHVLGSSGNSRLGVVDEGRVSARFVL